MIAEGWGGVDAATLAEDVRSLAVQVHRLLGGPSPTARDVRDALRRARRLRRDCRGLADDGLSRWVAGVLGRLEARCRVPA